MRNLTQHARTRAVGGKKQRAAVAGTECTPPCWLTRPPAPRSQPIALHADHDHPHTRKQEAWARYVPALPEQVPRPPPPPPPNQPPPPPTTYTPTPEKKNHGQKPSLPPPHRGPPPPPPPRSSRGGHLVLCAPGGGHLRRLVELPTPALADSQSCILSAQPSVCDGLLVLCAHAAS
eukprot:COSAG01_NODE_7497_length_3184_cov_1.594489_5_plen_176_part_00